MADSTSQVFTGARARLTLNGQPIGHCSGVDVSEEVAMEGAEVIDRFEVYEFSPVAYRVSMSARFLRIPRKNLVSAGIFPDGADTPDALRRNILNQLEMEAQIEDPFTGQVMGQLKRVKASSRNMSIGPRAIVGENVQFTAIYHRNKDAAA